MQTFYGPVRGRRVTARRGRLGQWCDRVSQVPDYFINDLVQEAATVGLPTDAVGTAIEHLIERRGQLRDLIIANKNVLPAVPALNWESF
jgi:hypothetical protein